MSIQQLAKVPLMDLTATQSEHYDLDDRVRRMLGKLSLEQKRKVVDAMQAEVDKLGGE